MDHNPFQHIDLRVTELKSARAFYSVLLPALGFRIEGGGEYFYSFSATCSDGATWFGFTVDPDHKPNANRIAFRGVDRGDVDRLAAIAAEAGARNVSGPRECPEYRPTYYAVFFDDPCGNPLEICHVES